MSRFLSPRFKDLVAYVPGEQPKNRRYIKLNTNESPFPPSKLVLERINKDELELLRLYPDPDSSALKAKIARLYGVESENVFVSNGSDEILSFSFMAFCDAKSKIAFPDITYGFYKVYAELYGIDYREIPLKDDFTIDINDYLSINKNIIIANPNAPTGICLRPCEIEKIVMTNPGYCVMIDEAYIDFGGESSVELVKKYDNVMIIQTFSKSRSLAGGRLGFAIAQKEIIADLEKIKYSTNPYNINRLSQIAGEAAIDDNDYYMKNAHEIVKIREFTTEKLKRLGFFVLDSKANFIFACLEGFSGKALYSYLKENGILVRNFGGERIKDFIRITIGTREEMERLICAAEKLVNKEENKTF